MDILDCLLDGREMLRFKLLPGRGKRHSTVSMSMRYVMKRAWFTCLEVPGPEDEDSWRDQQRFMYLRLRRLVGSVNEHLLDNIHYEREKLMRTTELLPMPTPPSISIYSGKNLILKKVFNTKLISLKLIFASFRVLDI